MEQVFLSVHSSTPILEKSPTLFTYFTLCSKGYDQIVFYETCVRVLECSFASNYLSWWFFSVIYSFSSQQNPLRSDFKKAIDGRQASSSGTGSKKLAVQWCFCLLYCYSFKVYYKCQLMSKHSLNLNRQAPR